MSENLDATTQVQGKGQAISGFILSLVGIVIPFNIIAIAAGSMVITYIAIALCLVSVILCAMAMGKLKKTGGKRGLAIAGLVIGLAATVWMALAIPATTLLVEARNKGVNNLENMTQDDWNNALKNAE
nr:hypothetical protein [uncultured Fluviicola sp.]